MWHFLFIPLINPGTENPNASPINKPANNALYSTKLNPISSYSKDARKIGRKGIAHINAGIERINPATANLLVAKSFCSSFFSSFNKRFKSFVFVPQFGQYNSSFFSSFPHFEQ